ncbi:MAG: hypothetical protein IPG62_14545 [Sphingomonadales bacterium]|nr:hypothetical protein [Sphingomonadales bacterium]
MNGGKQPTRTWYAGIDLARIMFVASLCMMAFVYGVATMQYRLFPYGVIMDARSAYKALRSEEDDALFAGVIVLDPKAAAKPVVATLDPEAGTEYLLVTGGPFQFMQRCPKYGCMAWIIDRKGNVLHSWEVDTDQLFGDLPKLSGRPFIRNMYPSGVALDRDGSLVMVFQARNAFPAQVGIAKVDRNGKLLWKRWDQNHHWPIVDRDGTIYAPYMYLAHNLEYFGHTPIESRCPSGQVKLEGIAIYDHDGKPKRRIDISKHLISSNYPGLLYSLRDGCDPIHLNWIEVVNASAAAKIPGVDAGDLLVSLRESGTIGIIDKDSGEFKRQYTGRTAGQHSPRFLPDGTLLVFDNKGGDRAQGGSRIVKLDLATGAVETVFPRPGETRQLPFFSDVAGHIDVSADGRRALITVKSGRSFEIDIATGRPLWSYVSNFDIAPYLKLQGINAKTSRATQKLWDVDYCRLPE